MKPDCNAQARADQSTTVSGHAGCADRLVTLSAGKRSKAAGMAGKAFADGAARDIKIGCNEAGFMAFLASRDGQFPIAPLLRSLLGHVEKKQHDAC
jgi:hypothetical protein